jgi:uncharacterized membrane protein YgcG
VGFFDFLRGRPRRRGRVEVTRRDNNDLTWWWLYMHQQSTVGEQDPALRQFEETCRAHGVDPERGDADVGSVPGLEESLADVCRQNGIEVPSGDTVVAYDAASSPVDLPAGADAGTWGGESGGWGGGSDSGGWSDSGGGGGGDSGGGGGGDGSGSN